MSEYSLFNVYFTSFSKIALNSEWSLSKVPSLCSFEMTDWRFEWI